LTDNIDVQLWAYKARSPDVLIATHRIKFSDLLSNQMYPTWINLYRLPYSERSGMFATGGEGQLSEYSDYTGRIQLAISTSITDDPIMEERACRPVALPPTSEWHLHCDIHMASGLAKLMGWSKLHLLCMARMVAKPRPRTHHVVLFFWCWWVVLFCSIFCLFYFLLVF
jgi:hypothetical protein